MKIKKWLGIPNLAAYENYINTWHYFLKNMKAFLEEQDNEEMSKKINVYILKIFFEEPYNNEDFYTQFENGQFTLQVLTDKKRDSAKYMRRNEDKNEDS